MVSGLSLQKKIAPDTKKHRYPQNTSFHVSGINVETSRVSVHKIKLFNSQDVYHQRNVITIAVHFTFLQPSLYYWSTIREAGLACWSLSWSPGSRANGIYFH